jgi:hypothetical protein
LQQVNAGSLGLPQGKCRQQGQTRTEMAAKRDCCWLVFVSSLLVLPVRTEVPAKPTTTRVIVFQIILLSDFFEIYLYVFLGLITH